MAKKIGAITTTYPWEQEGFEIKKFLTQSISKLNGMDRNMARNLKKWKSIFGRDMTAVYALAWRHVIDHRPRVVNVLYQVAYEKNLDVFLHVISLSQRCKSSARRNAAIGAKAKKTPSSGHFTDDELSRAATQIGEYFVLRLDHGKLLAALQEHFRHHKWKKGPNR